jgi:Na+-driven multidrug efflux pump/anti-sigma regulatory factor (Ser/Thr protein kinase)
MAAYSLANPLVLSIGAVGTLLAAGVQVACGKSLGAGNQEETNAGYSAAVAVAAIISVAFTAVVVLFAPFLARVMGAGSSGELFDMTKGYLAGFSLGAPGCMGALVLVPFLQMAGQSTLLIAGVVGMTVADIVLDLLSVLVFHGGMFGMGLASSLSYYTAMAVVGVYFLSRRCVFRFSLRRVSRRKITELFRGGIPACFNMFSAVILVFLLNRILKSTGGSSALAAYAVVAALGNAANCISTGVGGVSLTLSGIFYHEEDPTALRALIRQLSVYGVFLGLGVGVLLAWAAPALVSVFIPGEGEVRQAAVLGLRLFAAGMVPCCMNNALKNMYQGTGRELLTVLVSILEGTVFPALAAFVFSRFMGTPGAWLYFAAGETLALLFIGGLVFIKAGKLPWREDAVLLLKEGFGAARDRLLEMDIRSMQEVTEAARRAEEFCRLNGLGARVSNHIALCIEEMAGNTIRHGFAMDKKHHSLSVRLLRKEKGLVLRFRDDCGAFDPVHYIPRDGEDALGIRLVLAFAGEANYTYALNLNNVCIRIGDEEETGRC